jgi:hypothetical protein
MANTIEQELKKIGDQMVKQMQANLQKNGSNASRTLSNSITSFVDKPSEGVYTINIEMEDYGEIVDGGRGKSRTGGKRQTWRNSIKKWIQRKGIALKPGVTLEQAAFLITRKINAKGYKAKPFIKPAVDSVINQNKAQIEQIAARTLINQIDSTLR